MVLNLFVQVVLFDGDIVKRLISRAIIEVNTISRNDLNKYTPI